MQAPSSKSRHRSAHPEALEPRGQRLQLRLREPRDVAAAYGEAQGTAGQGAGYSRDKIGKPRRR
eukprot:358916-Chlamydomonas_euryale.AAC.3